MTEFICTYHPAFLKRDTRSGPAFIYAIKKAAACVRGQPIDPLPTILKNPTVEEVKRFFSLANGRWSFDTETTRTVQLRAIAFARDSEVIALDREHLGKQKLDIIKCEFQNASRIVVQNGAFDLPLMHTGGIEPNWDAVFDTMLAGYILEPDDYTNLSHLCSLYLNVRPWKHLSNDDLLLYNALDASHTWRLHQELENELREMEMLDFFLHGIMPLLHKVIIPLNSRGIALDLRRRNRVMAEWNRLYESWHKDLNRHFAQLSKDLGRDLRPPIGKSGGVSSPQLRDLLYNVLGLPVQYSPGSKTATTDKHALAKLEASDTTDTVSLLLRRSRLKENEVHLKVKADPDGRVRARYVLGGDEKHREFTEKGTSRARDRAPGTGRLASREPNHQNVPPSAKVIYSVSHMGWWMVEADFVSIEPRLTAYFSKDKALLEAINSGDIYLYTMLLIDKISGIYGVYKGGWKALQTTRATGDRAVAVKRQECKRSFLGWSYRMGARKLHLHTGIPYKRCADVLEALNHVFPNVVKLWQTLEELAGWEGYLKNPFGRIRRFRPPLDVPKACNFPAQSTAADILFRALRSLNIDLNGRFEFGDSFGYLLSTVHDSILVEGPDRNALVRRLREVMEQPIPELDNLLVPISLKAGKCWGELMEVK